MEPELYLKQEFTLNLLQVYTHIRKANINDIEEVNMFNV